MIAYFSGTGNSRLVARIIQKVVGDEIVSIPEVMKSGKKELESEKPFVIVCPVYSWKVPVYVEEFVRNTKFKGSSMVYFVLTCGYEPGTAAKYVENLCSQKSLDLMGTCIVTMPNNFILMYDAPTETNARMTIENSVPLVLEAAKKISMGVRFNPAPSKGSFTGAFANPMYFGLHIDSDGFIVNDLCDGCGKCVEMCPTECIKMDGDRPVWNEGCTQCLSCINRCPRKAIEFQKKTVGKGRYVCPFDSVDALRLP